MDSPIKIMDEIERRLAGSPGPDLKDISWWRRLRTAIEAQAESGLEHVGWQQRYLCPDEGPSLWCSCNDNDAAVLSRRTDYEVRKVYAINETDRQSAAHFKAEALREFGDNQRDEPAWIGWARVIRQRAYDEAESIEREAKGL